MVSVSDCGYKGQDFDSYRRSVVSFSCIHLLPLVFRVVSAQKAVAMSRHD